MLKTLKIKHENKKQRKNFPDIRRPMRKEGARVKLNMYPILTISSKIFNISDEVFENH